METIIYFIQTIFKRQSANINNNFLNYDNSFFNILCKKIKVVFFKFFSKSYTNILIAEIKNNLIWIIFFFIWFKLVYNADLQF